jgi:hypothetical protein
MSISELVTLAENRLMYLQQTRALAQQFGDTALLTNTEQLIFETETTLEKLRGL